MNASGVLLLTAIIFGVATSSTSSIAPYDLVEEIYAQYDELRSLVDGKMASAQTEFSLMSSDLSATSQNIYNAGVISISIVHQDNVAMAHQIKEAAASQGLDITSCTEGPEEKMSSLLNDATFQLEQCINGRIEASAKVVSATVDSVNGLTSRVLTFRFRIASCNGDLLCLVPISQDIQLAKVEILQEIDSELLQCKDWLQRIEVDVQGCSNNGLARYNSLIAAELKKIVNCLPR